MPLSHPFLIMHRHCSRHRISPIRMRERRWLEPLVPMCRLEGGPRIAFTAQYVTVTFPTDDSDNRALPWPNDFIGISAFVSAETPAMVDEVVQIRDDFVATSVENFEGQDHRMYWAAFGDVSMPEAAPFYFESEEKFNRLRDIKACVDPDELFKGIMTVPPAEKTPKGCKKKGKARKGKKMKKMKGKKSGKSAGY